MRNPLDLSLSEADTGEGRMTSLDLSRCLSENSPMPLIATEGREQIVRYVNPAFCRLVGKESRELVGHTFVLAVPEGEANGCAALFDRVYQTGATETLADQEHAPDLLPGIFWSCVAWPIFDAEERPVGVMMQATDTTEQTLARQRLNRFNQTLLLSGLHQQELTEVAEAGIQDLQRSVIELPVQKGISLALLINELVANAVKHGGQKVEVRLARREASAVLTVADDGAGFPTAFDPSTSAHFGLETIETVVRLELGGRVAYTNRPQGGALVTVAFPLAGSSSSSPEISTVPFASVFAPSLLQATMRSFTAFANTMQDHAIILLDEQANILKWSVGAERQFGYSVQEMLGKPLSALFTPEEVKAGHVAREIQQAKQEGRASDDRWMLRKDGSQFFASGVLTALTDSDVRGFVKILRDMTESKQAQEESTRQQTQIAVLQERNRLAQELHDTLAQGFVGIAMQLEAVRGLLASKREQAEYHLNRAATLARESLVEARRSVQALRPLLLQASELPTALAYLVEQSTVGTAIHGEFKARETRTLPPLVEDNLLRIAQEAVNNSLRHANPARIQVELTFAPDTVHLKIQDNGKGFDALAAPPSGHYGLVGMRERAERIGGQLVLLSQPGQGTEVSIVLPAPSPSSQENIQSDSFL